MAVILSVIFTGVVIFLVYKSISILDRYIRTLQLAEKVPGFSDTRVIQGDLWVESYDVYIAKTLKFVQTTHVKMHKVWVYFFYPVYCLDHPDSAKIVLKAAVPKDDNMGSGYSILKPWLGNGLLTNIGGRKWERNRRLLTPAFHLDILKEDVRKFNTVAENLLIRLSQCRDTSIEICQPVSVATLDALLQCVFSYDGHIQELGEDHPYVSAVQELSKYCVQRMSNPMLYPDFIFTRTRIGKRFQQLCNFVHEFADDVIKSRKNNLESVDDEQKERQNDFLDIILMARDETGNGLSDTEIRAEVDTLLFAGHDTTSSAISWGMYALAKYPDVQEKIHREVLDVVGTGQVEHNCIGQNFAIYEQKVILSRLVQTYRIELDLTHEVIPQPQLVMKPKHGIKVYLRSR